MRYIPVKVSWATQSPATVNYVQLLQALAHSTYGTEGQADISFHVAARAGRGRAHSNKASEPLMPYPNVAKSQIGNPDAARL